MRMSPSFVRSLCDSIAAGLCLALMVGCAHPQKLVHAGRLPNAVVIDANLTTSAQPSVEQLRALSSDGFRAVLQIGLLASVPPVTDEAQVIAGQGMVYARILVSPDNPTRDDLIKVAAFMRSQQSRRLLVHCDVNVLASTFVFLYRITELHDDVVVALNDLRAAWQPHGPMRHFIEQILAEHQLHVDLDAL